MTNSSTSLMTASSDLDCTALAVLRPTLVLGAYRNAPLPTPTPSLTPSQDHQLTSTRGLWRGSTARWYLPHCLERRQCAPRSSIFWRPAKRAIPRKGGYGARGAALSRSAAGACRTAFMLQSVLMPRLQRCDSCVAVFVYGGFFTGRSV